MYYRAIYVVVILSIAIGFVSSKKHLTPVEQCPGKNFEDLRNKIEVIPCSKSRCKMVRGTNTTVSCKFTPKTEIKELIIDVNAEVGGIPLPFIGVDGASACGHVQRVDTGEPAACPLLPDTEYIYTNVFPILQIYPPVALRVHWGLRDVATNKDAICFELPVVIV